LSRALDEDDLLDIYREYWAIEKMEGRRLPPVFVSSAPPGESVRESPVLVDLADDPLVDDLRDTVRLPAHCDKCGRRLTARDEVHGHACPPSPRPGQPK
jgi:hypothetical protein